MCHLHDAKYHIEISFSFALNQDLTSPNAEQAHQTEDITAIYIHTLVYYAIIIKRKLIFRPV